jgi:two-component system cell cycle response regulator CtrA
MRILGCHLISTLSANQILAGILITSLSASFTFLSRNSERKVTLLRIVAGVSKMRVLLVEGEAVFAKTISLMLQTKTNAIVEIVDTGEETLERVRHYDYDLVVLNLVLPDIEGCEVIRRIRARGQSIPILVLTGFSRPETKVHALSVGADDVMTKPFDTTEMVARIKAIVRRRNGHSQNSIQLGPLCLDTDSRQVSVEGTVLHLTGKEYATLELLVTRCGVVLTKEMFLNHLYGSYDNEPEIKIIDVFVCKLRHKLAQVGAEGLISTVWGRGYVLRAPNATPQVPVRSLESPLPSDALSHDDVGTDPATDKSMCEVAQG